jgi:hypothetical protein
MPQKRTTSDTAEQGKKRVRLQAPSCRTGRKTLTGEHTLEGRAFEEAVEEFLEPGKQV